MANYVLPKGFGQRFNLLLASEMGLDPSQVTDIRAESSGPDAVLTATVIKKITLERFNELLIEAQAEA